MCDVAMEQALGWELLSFSTIPPKFSKILDDKITVETVHLFSR